MKRKLNRLEEIALPLLLLIAVGACVKSCSSCKNELSQRPTIQDLHQLQEMKDYQKSQGREIIVFE